MGYSYEMFNQLSTLALKAGSRIIDVGSQDIRINDASELEAVNRFIRKFGGPLIQPSTPTTIEASQIFLAAGFDYLRIDIEPRPNTILLDISTLQFPTELRNSADLVSNAGTTEHLSNPVAGFCLIDYLCKPGGIMFHDVPMSGYPNHGLVNPTPKFWAGMIELNDYRVDHFRLRDVPADNSDAFHAPWSFMHGLASTQTQMARVIFGKRNDVFLPPLDVPGNNPDLLAACLRGALQPYIQSRVYTDSEVEKSIETMISRRYRDPRWVRYTRRKLNDMNYQIRHWREGVTES